MHISSKYWSPRLPILGQAMNHLNRSHWNPTSQLTNQQSSTERGEEKIYIPLHLQYLCPRRMMFHVDVNKLVHVFKNNVNPSKFGSTYQNVLLKVVVWTRGDHVIMQIFLSVQAFAWTQTHASSHFITWGWGVTLAETWPHLTWLVWQLYKAR